MPSLGATSWLKLPSNGFECILQPEDQGSHCATRLGCTLGPATRDVALLEQLLQSGMKVARFDFTYGNTEYHQQTLDMLREAMTNTKTACAIMLDTCGPEITVVNRPEVPISLEAGQTVALTCDRSQKASASVLPISLLTSFDGCQVAPGASIHVGRYLFTGAETSSAYLTVQQVSGPTVVCRVNNSCVLEGQLLTVHITGFSYPGPTLTEDDRQAIATWGATNAVDFVTLSHTRNAQDVQDCRAWLAQCGLPDTKVMAKIESLGALREHVAIIEAADAVVFSRGNLGLELDPEKVFLAQRVLLGAANVAGKPVYVTRVVDTMSEAPRPTRAEATDVANLVLDGADGILLGSETFRGKYPVATVQTVAAIARQAEAAFDSHEFYRALMTKYGCYTLLPNMDKSEALTSSAVRAAAKMGAKLIVVFTVTGRTARLMAKYKPAVPILAVVCKDASSSTYSNEDAFTSSATSDRHRRVSNVEQTLFTWRHGKQARQCLCYRGVYPISAREGNGAHSGELLDAVIERAKEMGLVQSGDRVVVSQCPRPGAFDTLEEAGVVKLVKVDDWVDTSLARNSLGNVRIALGGGAVFR